MSLNLNGMGVYVIAKALNQKGIPTIRGAEKWQDGVIQDILKNPIYEGDMLQQRTYTETRFPFVRRVNNGTEKPVSHQRQPSANRHT